MEAWLNNNNSLFKGLTVPMFFFFLSSFKVPMCLLGCSGFAFLRKNAKKSSVICMLFYFHLFPSMGLSVPLFMPLFSIAFLVLSLPIQILPFVFLAFFHFSPPLLVILPCDYRFFSCEKKKRKKTVGEGLFMVNGMYQSERTQHWGWSWIPVVIPELNWLRSVV